MDTAQCELHSLPGNIECQGVVFPKLINTDILKSPEIVDCRKDDVFVASYPKSGTTWAIEIVSLLMNGGDVDANRAVAQAVRNPAVEARIPRLFQLMMYMFTILAMLIPRCFHLHKYILALPWATIRAINGTKQMERIPSPRVLKTHLPFKFFPTQAMEKRNKCSQDSDDSHIHSTMLQNVQIAIILLPLSLRNHDGKYPHGIMTLNFGFGDWFDHVLGWWAHKDEDNILFIKYEDMKKDIRSVLRDISKFLEVDVSEEVLSRIVEYSTFEKMRDNQSVKIIPDFTENSQTLKFIRKGVVGDWKNHFTVAQNEHFDAVYAHRMKGTGLEFEW
ncbi:sulfotransferase 1B1-like [Saccoglossus kowalevskii]